MLLGDMIVDLALPHKVWTIVISCWTMPLLSLVPYTYTRLHSESEDVK